MTPAPGAGSSSPPKGSGQFQVTTVRPQRSRRRAERPVLVLSAFTAGSIDTANHDDEPRVPQPCQIATAAQKRALGNVVDARNCDPWDLCHGSRCRGVRRSRARIVARQDMGTRVQSHHQITRCRGPVPLTTGTLRPETNTRCGLHYEQAATEAEHDALGSRSAWQGLPPTAAIPLRHNMIRRAPPHTPRSIPYPTDRRRW